MELQLLAQVKEVIFFLRKVVLLKNSLKKTDLTWAVKGFLPGFQFKIYWSSDTSLIFSLFPSPPVLSLSF